MSFLNCINNRNNNMAKIAGYRLEGWLISKGFEREKGFENVWKLSAVTISYRASDDKVCIKTSIGTEEIGRLSELKLMQFWLELNGKHFYIEQKPFKKN